MILSDMLRLNQPIFAAYGTADITAEFCDLLPIYFIREGKQNLTLKAYPGLDHNFAETDANGNPDFDKLHWNDVIEDFMKMLNQKTNKSE